MCSYNVIFIHDLYDNNVIKIYFNVNINIEFKKIKISKLF